MCDPVTATALALSAGGTFLETREANKNNKRVQNARNAAFEEGMNRQRQYADEASSAFGHSTQAQGREAFDQKAATEVDRSKQAFARVQVPETDYNNMGMLASTPTNVVKAHQDATATADEKTQRDVNNNAALQSYGGALFNQGLDRNQFARLFGNLQDKAGRDSALIPLDMQAAGNNASKAPSLFPTLLKGAGMAMGMYGAANGITSFGDKVVPGTMQAGVYGPGVATTQPGLWTNLKQIPTKAFGGVYG